MQVIDAPDPKSSEPEEPDDPLARFRSWRGFLFAAVAVNLLFAYGMLNNTADASVAIWFKVLVWLPFNAIATALYIVFMVKLGKADAACAQAVDGVDKTNTGGAYFIVLCIVMIVGNWITMLAA